jgi:hypothetical protein
MFWPQAASEISFLCHHHFHVFRAMAKPLDMEPNAGIIGIFGGQSLE